MELEKLFFDLSGIALLIASRKTPGVIGTIFEIV